MFPLDRDENAQVETLSRMLLGNHFQSDGSLDRHREGDVGRILERYTPEVLSERLAEFLHEIIRKGERGMNVNQNERNQMIRNRTQRL